jgi:riboflavin transporter FmnP
VLKISSFVLMLLRCQPRAEDFQLRVDVVEMPAFVLKISSLVLMLLRCQLRAEDFQLSVDVDEMPASC